ncbi:MAG: fibronectin type III domain-containing protein [Flavobacteriales bacterium]|nr:fibronectin type III domain-containing protein [Flavobacteriales bacterium]
MKISLTFILSAISMWAMAQTITVSPYLQDASPHEISILWETNENPESTVEWGLTEMLGTSTSGSVMSNNGAQLHQVTLVDLERFTTYYYRVHTGEAQSEIHSFKTPPFASDDESFRLIAMSDMQKDGSNPDKFEEIIEDGVLEYLESNFGEEIADNLALVMIPGDLVVNGNVFDQWEDDFFDPSANLFSNVPVYPVPGNHENNAVYFFNYFKLPENGSLGFEEHWWFKDYGNARIIGMDSNGAYANEDQLQWLSDVLDETCAADSIDFVFAQLHHPHKSELWTPGESDFTGEVIEILEDFTSDCNKPSIHFFGHSHGYSRGQSRDHKHLWINVASAGGAIDYWGEWPQFDYDEFSVSQDEWGFVSVEVTAGETPSFTVKRHSRGNAITERDNEVTDSLTIRIDNGDVQTPTPLSPEDVIIPSGGVTLVASSFESGEATAQHGQTHWQISSSCTDFSAPVFESWKNYENQYNNTDTQDGVSITEISATGLQAGTAYCWRVRYRDREMNWSSWSEPASFTTCANGMSDNLVINPTGDLGTQSWTAVEGAFEALSAGECDGIAPYSGDYYFAVGGVCEDNPLGIAIQNINLTAYSDSIDEGVYSVQFGGHLSNWGGSDEPSFRLLFLDSEFAEISTTESLSTLNSEWTLFEDIVPIPVATVFIQFELTGVRNAGADNDSYFDDLYVFVGNPLEDCSEPMSITEAETPLSTPLLSFPNPWKNETFIAFESDPATNYTLLVFDAQGKEVAVESRFEKGGIRLRRSGLASGVYQVAIMEGTNRVQSGQFIVQ